jgi:hypothetical protein
MVPDQVRILQGRIGTLTWGKGLVYLPQLEATRDDSFPQPEYRVGKPRNAQHMKGAEVLRALSSALAAQPL